MVKSTGYPMMLADEDEFKRSKIQILVSLEQ